MDTACQGDTAHEGDIRLGSVVQGAYGEDRRRRRRVQGGRPASPEEAGNDRRQGGGFTTKPDIVLRDGERARYILDDKWKGIDASGDDGQHGIDQADMYQLYAYGKIYGCEAVALVYPRTGRFDSELRYRFFDGLPLVCLPFDVTRPEESVKRCLQVLGRERLKAWA